MKKLSLTAMAMVMALALAFPFAGCGGGGGRALKNVSDTYAYAAFSAASLMPESALPQNAYAPAAEGETQSTQTALSGVNEYVAAAQSLLSASAIDSSITTDVAQTQYGGVTYANRMNIWVVGINGQKSNYVFYFDEVVVNEYGEVEYESEGRGRQVTVEERESHVSSAISGVMVWGEQVYQIVGSKHVESEQQTDISPESEIQTTLKLTATAQSGARVKVVYEYGEETENGRTEYEQVFGYEVKNALGQVVSQGETEVETEANETEVEIRVSQQGAWRIFRLKKNGKGIRISYTENGQTVTATVRVITEGEAQVYEYTFSDGSVIKI